jgi:predicted DNA-binding transcriptional regulator AlpA
MDATTTTRAQRYLTNKEAAMFLTLSPRTLDKFRVLGGGPKFRKFGRRVTYALDDLEMWANSRICKSTSDDNYFFPR